MSDSRDRYESQHRLAVRAGAAGRNSVVRQPVSYLKFTEVDPVLKKSVKKSMKKTDKKPKSKPKTISKPKKPLTNAGQNDPPKKSALQKKLLEIGWQKYEQSMQERWR